MIASRLCVLALIGCLTTTATACRSVRDETPSRALRDYVAKEDPSYAWTLVGRETIGETEVVELRLQSQTWRGIAWKHRLFVLKPKRVSTGRHALLALSGGRWRPEYDEPRTALALPEDTEVFVGIAEALQSMFIVLVQVPYQPLFDLSEDDLIAYTFAHYLDSHEADWPLLLPMVKSAVRAMDASQEAARQLWNVELGAFTVLGGSKRGWATWLTAAVDRRVTAIAPIVIDALNMQAHFPHQTEAWGAPSEKIRPYTERNLHNILASEEGRELREIVDPYAYREQLTLPKLIINASNDEYFPIDSVNLYWSGLRGAKYALYVPNTGHDVDDLVRVVATMNQFHRAAAGIASMPRLEWEYELDNDIVRLCVVADPSPRDWRVWVALSEDSDFRDARWQDVAPEVDGNTATYERSRDAQAYLSLFVEPVFASADDEFTLTTTPAVLGPSGREPVLFSAVDQGRACH